MFFRHRPTGIFSLFIPWGQSISTVNSWSKRWIQKLTFRFSQLFTVKYPHKNHFQKIPILTIKPHQNHTPIQNYFTSCDPQPCMTFIHFLTGKSSGILSDISSGILSGKSSGILSGISSGILSDISSGILSGISSCILSGISSGILSDIPSGILSGISSGILSDISSGILSDIPSGISSGILSGRWGPAVPTGIWSSWLRSGSAHWDLELAVEVRQCPLRPGSPGWGPAGPTAICNSRLRSGSAHWDLELVVEVRLCPLGSGLRGGGGGWGGGGGQELC